MRGFGRLLLWAAMLSKRLYKKWTFLLILALIPALVLGYGMVDKTDTGVVTIALTCRDWEDRAAAQMLHSLKSSSQLIRFRVYNTEQAAENAVETGAADAAWIFLDDTGERLKAFAHGFSNRDAFVRVVEREKTVPLTLAREKLAAAAYELVGEAVYIQYLRTWVPALEDVPQDVLMSYYDQVNLNGQLFSFAAQGAEPQENGARYLTAPVRGLLAVVVVLSGLASVMYNQQDRVRGTFARVPECRSFLLRMGCQMIALGNVLLVAEGALVLSGESAAPGQETAACCVFFLSCLGFSMLLGTVFSSQNGIAVLLPVMTVAMLAVCPIFYDLGKLRQVQYLFPPTYFINGIYEGRYLAAGCVYAAVTLLAAFVLSRAAFWKIGR